MKTSDHRKRPETRGRRAAPVLTALALCLSSLAAAAQVDGPPSATGTAAASAQLTQKKRAIHELIRLTDAAQLEDIFSQQFIDRVANAVAVFRPDMNARTMEIIEQESRAVIQEHINSGDALYSVLYPVYSRHFNLIELNQLINFYQSPLGQKLVRVSPELLTETLSLGRQWALSLVPEILQRVQARLDTTKPSGENDNR